jgi:hypothetical protein
VVDGLLSVHLSGTFLIPCEQDPAILKHANILLANDRVVVLGEDDFDDGASLQFW